MKVFTYGQYIKCIHTLRLNAVLQLAEESVEYNLQNSREKYLYERLIKNILEDKEEAKEFINEFLKPRENVTVDNLVKYTNKSINKKYKSKEADLIYKLKNQDIFFLIEYQFNINSNTQYRILNYCIDIMQEWSRNNKNNKNMRLSYYCPNFNLRRKSKLEQSK